MLFNFFGHTFGKVKNENDMLGFLIANKLPNGDVPSKQILDNLDKIGLDSVSANKLLRSLESLRYIAYATDVMTVFKLGENNYNSPVKIFVFWFFKVMLFTTKTLVSYIAGIASVVIAEIIILYITTPESVAEFLRSILLLLSSRL